MSTLATIARHLAQAVAPLRRATTDLASFQAFMLRLGWTVDSRPSGFAALATRVERVLDSAATLADSDDPERVLDVLAGVQELYDAIGELTEAPAGVEPAEFLAEIGESLFELLLVEYLAVALPALHDGLRLLGAIEHEDHPETAGRPGFVRTRLRYDLLARALDDPGSVPGRLYGWGTDDVDTDLLAEHLLGLSSALRLPVVLEPVGPEQARGYQPAPDDATGEPGFSLLIPLLELRVDDVPVNVSLVLLELPAEGSAPAGVILQPAVPGSVEGEVRVDDRTTFRVRAGSDVENTFGILVRGSEVAVRYPFQPGTALPAAGFGVAVEYRADAPSVLLGRPGGTRLEAQGATGTFEVDRVGDALELRLGLAVDRLVFTLSAGDLDGFLGDLLGSAEGRIPIPLALQWSSRTGVGFVAGAGLERAIAAGYRLGAFTVLAGRVRVAGTAGPGAVPKAFVEVGLSVSAAVGPVRLEVRDLGLRLELSFAAGNAGPLDVGLGVRAPDAIGLALEAGPVTGGGVVGFDESTGRYTGALALQLTRISVRAIGLLDTRLPGGQRGFSLLVLLSARFSPGIQVGFGVTLTGVGGLVGVNRRIDVDALYERYASGTAARILAAEDPVRDLPAAVTELSAIFPPAPGVFVVGPTLRLQWAKIVTLDVGVFLEFPGPTRVVVLGTARADVTNPLAAGPLLRLRADFVGVLDMVKSTLAFDAVLVDSRLLESFPVTGGLLVRASWGDEPYAVFSVGGFHPDFAPGPLKVPKTLTRLAMSSGSPGDRLYLRFEGYFALTPNTVQFGASVEVAAKLGPIRVRGVLAFNALIRFEPFFFQITFEAGMRAEWRGRTLLGLKVRGTLSGPGPVRFTGKACIEVLFFDICASASFTLGSEAPPAVGPAPNVLDVVADELRNPANLRAAAEDRTVVLRRMPSSVFPPTGLIWEQTRAPLGLLLDRFEGTPLGRAEIVEVIGDAASGEERDWFAPGGFAELSDAEALNRRSFERLPSGVRFGTQNDVVSAGVRHDVTTREFILPAPTPQPPSARTPRAAPPWLIEAAQVREGRSDGRRSQPVHRVEPERWQVLDQDGGVLTEVGEAQAHQIARARGFVAVAAGDVVDIGL
ncbi:DUF6603 domain-containing protein [Cryptosporangium minutisporangium]|uniref:DUF6603 domain-containing protein n=1 Tax=Cryptosporangium minutisporangium TaxID=113569 RepID=A0ABP6SZE7_9ACTN